LAGNIAEIPAREARIISTRIISIGGKGSTIPVIESVSAPWDRSRASLLYSISRGPSRSPSVEMSTSRAIWPSP
jgi:hypothetical protein